MQKRTTTPIILVIVVMVGFAAACGGSTPAEEAPEEPAAATGETLLQERCTTCHGLDRVKQAQKSKEEWDKNVTRMVEKGAKLNQEEQSILVAYLAENYGP